MNTPEHQDHRFVLGLLTGTFVGVGLTIWLAPRSASELCQRVTDAVKTVGERASEQYQQASTHLDNAVGDLTRKGRDIRNNIADVVAHGAHEVEHYATAAKTDRAAGANGDAG